jgi:hypothetical protein
MTENVPSYRVTFISSAIERAPVGSRGLFVERAGNTVSICASTVMGGSVEVILVLSPEEAGALGEFLTRR